MVLRHGFSERLCTSHLKLLQHKSAQEKKLNLNLEMVWIEKPIYSMHFDFLIKRSSTFQLMQNLTTPSVLFRGDGGKTAAGRVSEAEGRDEQRHGREAYSGAAEYSAGARSAVGGV